MFTNIYIVLLFAVIIQNEENFAPESVVVCLVWNGRILFTTVIALFINERKEMFHSWISAGRPSIPVRSVQV